MKPGDIIRSACGVGRYIRVTDIRRSSCSQLGDQVFGMYMSKVGNISDETLLPVGTYEVMNIHKLSVSKEEFENLRRYATSISHKATPNWEALIDNAEKNGVDILMFYNRTKKIYYTFDAIKRACCLKWNKNKTICKREMCITIFLGSLIAIE